MHEPFTKTEFKTIKLGKTLDFGIPVGQGKCKAVRIALNKFLRNSIIPVDLQSEPFFIYYGDAQSQEIELKAQDYDSVNASQISAPTNVSPLIYCRNQEEVFIRYAGKEVEATPGTQEVLNNTILSEHNAPLTANGNIRVHFDGIAPSGHAGCFPHNVDVAVLMGDSRAQVRDKLVTAINLDVILGGVLTASAGAGALLVITMDEAAANDLTLVCNIADAPASPVTGLTPTDSTIATAGVAPTAEQVGASVNWPEFAYVQVVIYS